MIPKEGLKSLDGGCGPHKVPLMSVAPNSLGGPPPLGVSPQRHRRPRTIVSLVALMLCWACGGGATDVPEDVAGREAFIGAYLDLRTEAVSSGSTEISDEVRDSILSVYGVNAQDLLDFIDTHGENVEFMSDLWTEIETRMAELLERNARAEEDEGTAEADETG